MKIILKPRLALKSNADEISNSIWCTSDIGRDDYDDDNDDDDGDDGDNDDDDDNRDIDDDDF